MDQPRQASRRETMVIGAICAAIGLYFVLVSLGALPLPSKAYAQMWVVTLVGLCSSSFQLLPLSGQEDTQRRQCPFVFSNA